MRLWHYKLVPALPRGQLLSQWRECVALAKGISETGKTNHILVNRIMDYPTTEFRGYCLLVLSEMERRGYSVAKIVLERMYRYIGLDFRETAQQKEFFTKWHDDKYLRQCFYNLEEKHDCGGITDAEWSKIEPFRNVFSKD